MPEGQSRKRKRCVGVKGLLSKYKDTEPKDYAAAFERFRQDLIDLDDEPNPILPSLAATTLSVGAARRIFGIVKVNDVFWNKIEELQVPAYLTDNITRILAITNPEMKSTEAFSRRIIDQILISAIYEENVTKTKFQDAADSQPQYQQEDPALLHLQHETQILRKVKFEGEDRLLSGFADYTVWYDARKSTLATNLIIVEAKKLGGTDMCLPQLTAYMGAVHDIRKEEGKTNSTVFGAASDGNLFRFCRIDNDGRWSQSFLLEWEQGQESQIYSMFRTLIRIAALSSPSTSPIKDPEKRERVLAEFGTPTRSTSYDFGLKDLEIYEEGSDIEIVELPSSKRSKDRA